MKTGVLLVCVLIAYPYLTHAQDAYTVPEVRLQAFSGGEQTEKSAGECEDSSQLALVLYTSPKEKQMVELVRNTVDSASEGAGKRVRIYYVLDKSRTLAPSFAIRKMLEGVSGDNPGITYMIDHGQTLAECWGFRPQGARVFLLDHRRRVLFNRMLPLSRKSMLKLLSIINSR